MKRSSLVTIRFENGTKVQARVVTDTTRTGTMLRDEANEQHDAAVDNVVGALRTLPYLPTAPLRRVSIQGRP